MNVELSSEAREVGQMLRERLEAEGGVDILRRCAADPSSRSSLESLLGELGIWDIDPREGAVELEVAAEVSRAAGSVGLPYPVVERLAASGASMTVPVARSGARLVNHVDLGLDWNALDLEGRRYAPEASFTPVPLGTKLAPFSSEVALVADEADPAPRDAALLLILQGWWQLGLLETALDDTVRYTGEREQFGRKLSHFQAVAFQLADMALETNMTAELAKYALWTLANDPSDEAALTEALALQVGAQRAAEVVMRGAHQLHGAMGFTDEVDVSWLSRASQSARRLPEDSQRTLVALRSRVESQGYGEFGYLSTSQLPG